ncbi:MAG: hypothetical protein ACE5HE_12510, partial [Phycisphaerae bacterium]
QFTPLQGKRGGGWCVLFGRRIVATFMTLEQWAEECDRIRRDYVKDMRRMRRMLGKIVEATEMNANDQLIWEWANRHAHIGL